MHARAWERRAQRVPGTVTDVHGRLSGSGRHLRAVQRPVLSFTTLDGRPVTTESRLPSDHGIGNEVAVRYDPANPTDAEIDEGASPLAGLGLVAVGLVMAVVGFGFFLEFSALKDAWPGGDDSGMEQCIDGNGDEIDCPPGLFDE